MARVFCEGNRLWLTFLRFSDTLLATMRPTLQLLIPLLLVLQYAAAQSPGRRSSPRKDPPVVRDIQNRETGQSEVRRLFRVIEQGISGASLASAAPHFAPQVFVNMSSGESGYFSANQTVSILQRYFSGRSSLSFEFSRYSETGSTPYATGRLLFTMKGRRESAQVYISLRFSESRWVISQFNIY